MWLILILSPLCCHDDKMISPATIVYDKYKGDFFNIHIRWGLTPPTDIASCRAHIFRVSRNLSDLFPLSLPDTIAFIPSGVNTQKKEIIPYPRCDYRADGIWYYFFFRLFSSNELNSNPSDFVENLLLFVKECD